MKKLILPALLTMLSGCGEQSPGRGGDSIGRTPSEPVVTPAPTQRASCGPGSQPELGLQGRITAEEQVSGRAAAGYMCNTEQVGSYIIPNARGTVGGFWVHRYIDNDGKECAIYDTTLTFPTNALDGQGGVNVLDMSDPSAPVLKAQLVTPAMLTPHESLRVNQQRGLLAAVSGNLNTAPGIVDLYDLSADCWNPTLQSSLPVGVLGHESGFSPDGNTYYVGSAGGDTITAIDVTNPVVPVILWVGDYSAHGMEVSDDGNRLYVAAVGANGLSTPELIILDVSEIKARTLNPTVSVISRLQWTPVSIPQLAIPFTSNGKAYILETDEFGGGNEVGAARIINIDDETAPHEVSTLRLEVHDPQHFDTIANDPGANTPAQGYGAHYCNIPTRDNPKIAACSMILSGLRIFDISDPENPVEAGYFNAPQQDRITPTFETSNWAMSGAAFVPERKEIWYSDGYSGLYVVRVTNGAWPD